MTAERQENLVRGQSETVFKVFGAIYDFITDHPLWYQQNVALMAHFGDRAAAPRVLDLGCGTGVGTLAVAERLPDRSTIVGVDLTPEMIARAQLYHQKRHPDLSHISFERADATQLRFDEATFDVAMANSFLYLVPDPQRVLREVRRVLAPGGRMVLMEPHAGGSIVRAAFYSATRPQVWLRHPLASLRMVAAMAAWRIFSGLAGRRSIEEQRRMIEAAGFSSVRFEPTLGGLGVHVIAER
ncbi:MAG: methyltransferase domain-containing protein [Deltaproteobacteria bacterium]|nr:methyltransferase domain-containing protein [Deltaproteobacteria bacterium]